MKKIVTPFRVGLLVIATGVFLFAFLTFVKKGGMSKEEAITVHAYFKDASGLGKKSRVQVAGIPVGEIDAIVLEGERAKVMLKIRRDLDLHKDATLKKRSESLLGDYMLDLTLGTSATPRMEDGDEITRVIDQQGMEAVMASVEKITGDVQAVTGSLRQVLGNEKGAGELQQILENLARTSANVDETVRKSQAQVDVILANLQTISGDVRGLTHGNKESLEDIIQNLDSATRDTKDVLATIKRMVGSQDQGGDIQQSVASLKSTIERLDRTLANVEDVTNKVKEGKGTVGTLLTDERMGQKLSETVDDISDFASRITNLKVEASIRSEYFFSAGGAKNTFGVRLVPKPDKYYLLELADDVRGSVETTYIQTNPPGTGQPVTQVQRVTKDSLKLTAQFAKRYYFLTLRFGLLESTGAIGADAHFFNDALTLKLDAFNFSVPELKYPRLRATLRLQAFEHLFATVGIDDALNRQVRDDFTNRLVSGQDFFVGAGVYFTDDDLKSLLPVVPLPK